MSQKSWRNPYAKTRPRRRRVHELRCAPGYVVDEISNDLNMMVRGEGSIEDILQSLQFIKEDAQELFGNNDHGLRRSQWPPYSPVLLADRMRKYANTSERIEDLPAYRHVLADAARLQHSFECLTVQVWAKEKREEQKTLYCLSTLPYFRSNEIEDTRYQKAVTEKLLLEKAESARELQLPRDTITEVPGRVNARNTDIVSSCTAEHGMRERGFPRISPFRQWGLNGSRYIPVTVNGVNGAREISQTPVLNYTQTAGLPITDTDIVPFSSFPELPKEIRDKIWKQCLPVFPARIVILNLITSKADWADMSEPVQKIRFASPALVPAVLQVCAEARAEALRSSKRVEIPKESDDTLHYTKAFATKDSEPSVIIDFSRDIVWLGAWFEGSQLDTTLDRLHTKELCKKDPNGDYLKIEKMMMSIYTIRRYFREGGVGFRYSALKEIFVLSSREHYHFEMTDRPWEAINWEWVADQGFWWPEKIAKTVSFMEMVKQWSPTGWEPPTLFFGDVEVQGSG